jgi:Ca2+-binding EF-hand superfamily protein
MVNAVKRKVLRKKIEPKARSAFDRLDSDGSGALNRKELEIAFRSMGRKITK